MWNTNGKKVLVLLIICALKVSDQKSTPQDDSYVAAVVEYEVVRDVETNIKRYVDLIEQAAQQNADIIVFPEMTLTSGTVAVQVPIYGLLKTNPIPALAPSLYDEILVNISATAREHQIYVVINIQEQLDCTAEQAPGEYCPEEKTYLFNTNVVFDRKGAVIDRYRKINLFGEFTRTPALRPELGVFTTDFGVTFGHFICFDLLFQVPAVQVVEKLSLTDVIFSTMWFSEMPYLTAVQIQEAYAYAKNINFLASGANNVGVGSAGSGIYSGKAGALVSTMPGVPTTRLIVSRVPKVPGRVNFDYPGPIYDKPTDHDGLVLITDPSIPSHTTRVLVPGFQEFTLVDKEVSCRFRVTMNQRDGDQTRVYRAMVRDGNTKYLHLGVGVAMCSIIACRNENIHSCPFRFNREDKSIEFEELSIQMTTYRHQYNNTLKCDNVAYYPVTLQTNKFPLQTKDYTFTDPNKESFRSQNRDGTQNGRAHISFSLNSPQDAIIGVGVYGRIYNKDVLHDKEVTEEDVEKYIAFENRIYAASHKEIVIS